MKRVGAYEAKTNLSRLLDEVEGGETIAITKHGRPVALLTPISGSGSQMTVERAVDGIRAFRRGHRLDGVTLRELIADGRRR